MSFLDINVEAERVKDTAAEVFSNGGFYQPMIGIFEEGNFKGAIILRQPQEDDSNDRKNAFAEACTLIPFLHGDEVVVSFDANITRVDTETKEEVTFEAVNLLMASNEGADARLLPYTRDEEGNFIGWAEDDETDDDIDPYGLSGNMIQTLAHFMSFHHHLEFPEVMMRSLAKRGHIITLPDGQQFLPPSVDDTIPTDKEMKKAIREG